MANDTSPKTDAARPGAGSTNAAPPRYDTRPPAPIPTAGAAPAGQRIPRDTRPNSGRN